MDFFWIIKNRGTGQTLEGLPAPPLPEIDTNASYRNNQNVIFDIFTL